MNTTTQRLIPYRLRGAQSGLAVQAAPEAPPVRARGAGEILDVALDVFGQRFWFCAGTSAFLWLLANGFADRKSAEFGTLPSGLVTTIGVQYLTTAFVVVAVYGELQGQRIPGRRALALACKRFPALAVFASALILASMLATQVPANCAVLLLPMFLAALLLGVWLLALAPAAIVLENIGPLQAVRRSVRLALGALRTWVVLSLLQSFLVLPFASLPAVLDDPVGRLQLESALPLPFAFGDAFWLVVRSLFEGVSTAFGAVVMAVWYVDRRVRIEGFDLVMRLERVRARDARRAA